MNTPRIYQLVIVNSADEDYSVEILFSATSKVFSAAEFLVPQDTF
jgi:hypothetical protein